MELAVWSNYDIYKVKRITVFGRKLILVCHRLNYNDNEFLSPKCMEALVLNWCGKRVVTLTLTGSFVGWDPKVGRSVMENWGSAEKGRTSRRSPALRLFSWDVLCLVEAALRNGAQIWQAQHYGLCFLVVYPDFDLFPLFFFVLCGQTLLLLGLSDVSWLPPP